MKGDLQESNMERLNRIENSILEIASLIASKCVDPTSNRPYSVRVIREAMKKAEFNLNERKTVKQQFLECVKLIKMKGSLPLERAKMELCAVFQVEPEDVLLELRSEDLELLNYELDIPYRVGIVADPSLYRKINDIVENAGGRLEIARQCVREEGDANLESEISRKDKVQSDAKYLQTIKKEEHANSPSGSDILPQLLLEGEGLTSLAINNRTDHGGSRGEHVEPNSRKEQKKAQKKSKKAKRREKLDGAEREDRIQKEKTRQKERQERINTNETPESASKKVSLNDASAFQNRSSCNTCGGSFSKSEYRCHFRSDWHRYNLKLKLNGVSIISEEEFNSCDANFL